MKRSAPLRQKKPMNRGTSTLKRSGFAARTLVKPSARTDKAVKTQKVWKSAKPQIFRSEWLLAFVRQLPCMCCSFHSLTEAAHSNQLRFGKGKGVKASDAAIMALCKSVPGRVGCHANHDQGGKLSKQEWKEFEHRMIAKTILELIKRGALIAEEGLIGSFPRINGSCEELAVALVEHIETGRLKVVK